MFFKIDAKENYCLITPSSEDLNVNVAVALQQKCNELTQSGSSNYIIDMNRCKNLNDAAFQTLVRLHQALYTRLESLVFIGICKEINNKLQQFDAQHMLNIAPTIEEALDIISMDQLERDILGESEDK